MQQLYRVREQFRAIYTDGKKGILTIPAGATLTVLGLSADKRLIRIIWNGVSLWVFSRDFGERTTPAIERGVR